MRKPVASEVERRSSAWNLAEALSAKPHRDSINQHWGTNSAATLEEGQELNTKASLAHPRLELSSPRLTPARERRPLTTSQRNAPQRQVFGPDCLSEQERRPSWNDSASGASQELVLLRCTASTATGLRQKSVKGRLDRAPAQKVFAEASKGASQSPTAPMERPDRE